MSGGVFLHDENAIATVVTLVTGGLCGFFEVALFLIFVQHGFGFDSLYAKNECDMIQPAACSFAGKAKPPVR